MNLDISCELIALVMLVITIVFYNYKNWIDVKKNRAYLELLHWSISAISLDLFGNVLCVLFSENEGNIERIFEFFMGVMMLVIGYRFCYYMVVSMEALNERLKKEMRVAQVFVGAGIVYAVIALIIGHDSMAGVHLVRAGGRGGYIEVLIMLFCMVMGIGHLFVYRKRLVEWEFFALLISASLLGIDLVAETFLEGKFIFFYYFLSLILVSCYILLHNMDRYRFKSSGCFSRAGLRVVLQEKEQYQENFFCLALDIKNIESITNYFTEEEIVLFHQQMGSYLQRYGGKHNVYHTHSFEYLIIVDSREELEKKYALLKEKLPGFIQVWEKKITLSINYYGVGFEDADYNMNQFYSIITSMRKLSSEQVERGEVFYYHGNEQQDIAKNLEAMRIVNRSIVSREFSLKKAPILSLKKLGDYHLEFYIEEQYEDGSVLSQENIWRFAEKMGLIKELGRTVFEQICEYISKEELVTSEIKKVHINLKRHQLEDLEYVKGYLEALKRYHIPGKFICIEVTIDHRANYALLEQAFGILRGSGVSLLLDQFGASANNMKSVIDLPFNAVKVNHYQTSEYCKGNSSQLPYLLDMLNNKEWEIVLDGVGDKIWFEKLEKLNCGYLQGGYINELYENRKTDSESGKIGGVLVG